ncbi:MAG: TAXI family TRAP transporter solute-binding subunit [Pseudomonadota bacterium]
MIKLPLALLALAVMAWLWTHWLPLPRTEITLSTALPEGMYHAWGRRYAEAFARQGIQLRVVNSDGAGQNLERLRGTQSPAADLAFMQGGVGHPGSSTDRGTGTAVVTLAMVDIEPVWIFSRHGFVDSLQQLQGQRVSLGPAGSGTRRLALAMLEQVRITPKDLVDSSLSGMSAVQALQDGTLDTLIMVSQPDSPVVRALLRAPGVHLVQLKRSAALTERLPYLQPRLLAQGTLDPQARLPARDATLLTTTASLVARTDLEPALQRLATRVAQQVHAGGGLFHRPGTFPSLKRVDFPASVEARRTLLHGPPWLEEQLPFMWAQVVLRLLAICLPVALLAWWLAHLLPAYLRWLVESRVTRWYGELMYIEYELARDSVTGLDLSNYLGRLNSIEKRMAAFVTPVYLMPRWFMLRDHIEFVRMGIYQRRGR